MVEAILQVAGLSQNRNLWLGKNFLDDEKHFVLKLDTSSNIEFNKA